MYHIKKRMTAKRERPTKAIHISVFSSHISLSHWTSAVSGSINHGLINTIYTIIYHSINNTINHELHNG